MRQVVLWTSLLTTNNTPGHMIDCSFVELVDVVRATSSESMMILISVAEKTLNKPDMTAHTTKKKAYPL